jgi:hypothetical protein
MAEGRGVDAEESGHGVIVREIVRGPLTLRQGGIVRVDEGIMASSSSGDGTRPPAHGRLSGTAEDGGREGLGPRASMPDVAGIVPATRGLIAAPWTPASLSLLPPRRTNDTDHVSS